jgi:hypothetical protein
MTIETDIEQLRRNIANREKSIDLQYKEIKHDQKMLDLLIERQKKVQQLNDTRIELMLAKIQRHKKMLDDNDRAGTKHFTL